MSDEIPGPVPKAFTAKKIATSLYWKYRSASEIIIPNYTPKGWWECDVWRLTSSGFTDEYEIKLTVSDFKADSRKSKKVYGRWCPILKRFPDPKVLTKHDILRGSEGGPNRFWFVLPEPMANMVVIPEYAGLIVASKYGGASIQKEAPKRHKGKWDGDRLRVMGTFYHRFFNIWAGSTAPIESVEG